jgi:hypothetical protein
VAKAAAQIDDIAVWFASHAKPEDCYRAFEAYGHAMAAAATFEHLMALMIGKAVAQRIGKRANTSLTAKERRQWSKVLMSKSFDRLRIELNRSFKLSAELQQALKDGKDFRDHLAHNFWPAHTGHMLTSEGVDVIATVCAATANHFRVLANALLAETDVHVHDYIEMIVNDPSRDQKIEGWRHLLAQVGLR